MAVKMPRYLFILIIFVTSISYAQWDQVTPDSRQWVGPVQLETPTKRNNDGPGSNRTNGPTPQPVEDNHGNGNSNSSGNGNSGGTNGSNNQNHVSPADSKNDQHYDNITREGPGGGTNNGASSQSLNPGNKSNTNDGQESHPSSSYDQIVSKGNAARSITHNEKSNSQKDTQGKQSIFIILIDESGSSGLDQVYSNDVDLITNSQKVRIINLTSQIVNYNQNNICESDPQNLINPSHTFDEVRQKLLKGELQRMFPGAVNKSLSEVSQAKKMIQNWKLIDNVIGDSLFGDEFIKSDSAIQNIQNSINLEALPPVDSKLLSILDQAKTRSLQRFYGYTSGVLQGLPAADTDDSYRQEAAKLTNYAFQNILSQNFTLAATNISEAKKLLEHTGGLTIPILAPDDLLFIGLPSAIIEGITKYGVGVALKDIGTAEERNIIRALIEKYSHLRPGQIIRHNSQSRGVLNFIAVAPNSEITVSETFVKGEYAAKLANKKDIFFRYYTPGKTKDLGSYMTRLEIKDPSIAQDLLSMPSKPTHYSVIKPSVGHLYFEGTAGKFFGKNGSGDQIYIIFNDNTKLYNEWIVNTHEVK